jgi:hypothetical protein
MLPKGLFVIVRLLGALATIGNQIAARCLRCQNPDEK